jgi:hypothetical protein
MAEVGLRWLRHTLDSYKVAQVYPSGLQGALVVIEVAKMCPKWLQGC